MRAILKRDFKSFFNSPLGYVFCGVFSFLVYLFFVLSNVFGQNADLKPLFSQMLTIFSFTVPVLTMRAFSEEAKLKTDQILLTSPVTVWDIVLGKFFAAFGVFMVAIALTFLLPIVLMIAGTPNLVEIFGNYVALIVAGSAYIAIGIFVSSLTESQLIAAIVSFAIFLFLPMLDWLSSVNKLFSYISFQERFSSGFSVGLFSFADIIFYLSVVFVFCFLTSRVLEKKRYA